MVDKNIGDIMTGESAAEARPEIMTEVEKEALTPEKEREYLSAFEQLTLEKFRHEVQLKVDESQKKGEFKDKALAHLEKLNVNELDEKELRLYKMYLKFCDDYQNYYQPGWPDIYHHPFMTAVRIYEDSELVQLRRTPDTPEPERDSKTEFDSYLKTKALSMDAKYREDRRKEEKRKKEKEASVGV